MAIAAHHGIQERAALRASSGRRYQLRPRRYNYCFIAHVLGDSRQSRSRHRHVEERSNHICTPRLHRYSVSYRALGAVCLGIGMWPPSGTSIRTGMSKKGLTISARRDFIDILFHIVPLERCAWALAYGLLAAHPSANCSSGWQSSSNVWLADHPGSPKETALRASSDAHRQVPRIHNKCSMPHVLGESS